MCFKNVPSIPAVFGMVFAAFIVPQASLASVMTPDVDRIILTVGQDVDSVNSYTAALGCPGGIMSYTSTAGVEGLSANVDYGSGNIDAQYFTGNPAYTNTIIQLGLYIDGDLANIVSGVRDGNIAAIGNWIKSAGRPVYLRIGYEFDGPWNALPPDQYIAAYRYIVNAMRANGVTNAVYVWHSSCSPTYGGYPVSAWYPGDDYVDWAGISVYQQFDGTLGTVADIDNFCAFAKSRNKPIMIAESTPFGGLSNARWANWFLPCLDLIHRHHIQMWSYIDTDWDALPMFAGQGWGDSRIENNPYIASNWLAVVESPAFLQQSAELYPRLHADATNSWCEAENAGLNGAYVYSDSAASGGEAVSGLAAPGCSVTFTNGGTAQQFVLRYSAMNFGTLGLYVNSQPRRTLPIPATGGAYSDLLIHQEIPAGALIKIEFDAGDAPVNLDAILFRGYQDSYGSGVPDDWVRWRFGSVQSAPGADPGNTGNSIHTEFVADADPMNGNTLLRIGNLTASGTGTLTISHAASRTCFVQRSTDLQNWTYLPIVIQTNTDVADVVLNNLPAGKVFYRLVVP